MSRKIISLNKGIRRNPTIGDEGELIDCVDLVVKNGELVNAPRMEDTTLTIIERSKLLHVHKTSDGSVNYITDKSLVNIGMTTTTPKYVTSVGNVLIAYGDNDIYYFMWHENAYVKCNFADLRDLNISFALDAEHVTSSAVAINVSPISTYGNAAVYTKQIFTTSGSAAVSCMIENAIKSDSFTVMRAANGAVVTGKCKYVKVDYNIPADADYSFRVHYAKDAERYYSVAAVKFSGIAYPVIADIFFSDYDKKDTEYNANLIDHFLYSSGLRPTTIESIYFLFDIDIDGGIYGKDTVYGKYQNGFTYSLYARSSYADQYAHTITRDSENIKAFQGDVNEFINTQSVLENKFMYPFFVRYGVRMYDGSVICLSSPVLMLPSTTEAPSVYISNAIDSFSESEYLSFGMEIAPVISAVVGKLQYSINNSNALAALKARPFLIKSLVIAVTPPIYSYNSDPNDIQLRKALYLTKDDTDSVSYAKIESKDSTAYKKYNKSELDLNVKGGGYRVTLPMMDDANPNRFFSTEASTFRIISEISIDKLTASNSFVDVPMESETLVSLNTREVLKDDVSGLTKYVPMTTVPYNGRLVYGNIAKYLPWGTDAYCMANYTGPVNIASISSTVWSVVYITKDGQELKVVSKVTVDNRAGILYFYYPDPDASRAEIYFRNTATTATKRTLPLTKHPYLNGAYWFGKMTETPDTQYVTASYESDMRGNYTKTNEVLSSKANNPFVADAENANMIGNGEIRRIAAITMATDQQQHGKAPLMCLNSEGIWGVSINDEGKFVSTQAIARDVILEDADVLQTDNSIIFPTSKGLLAMQNGSLPKCISKNLEGRVEADGVANNFVDEISKCKLLWDSDNGYVHVFISDNNAWHYIFNVESGEWSRSSEGCPASIVAGYPRSWMQIGTKLYQYKNSVDVDGHHEGTLLTREVAFDNAFALKILNDMRVMRKQLWFLSNGDKIRTAKVKIFVSNDRQKWYRLKSLKAHSWKWYRFAITTKLTDVDGLEGIVCDVEERRTNKLR